MGGHKWASVWWHPRRKLSIDEHKTDRSQRKRYSAPHAAGMDKQPSLTRRPLTDRGAGEAGLLRSAWFRRHGCRRYGGSFRGLVLANYP